MFFQRLYISLAVLMLLSCATQADAFTYQGKLTDSSGQPANGSYTMLFRLWDAATGGSQVETTITKTAVPVSGGLFTIELDFGAVPFRLGLDRWLEVEVGSQTLSPRAKITTVPMAVYAQTAQSVPWSGITGVPSGLQPGGAAGGDLTGTYPNPALATAETSLAKVSGGVMTASGGKVGIGTASPGGVFEVVGQRGVRDQECNGTTNMVTLTTHFVLAQSFTAGVSGVMSAIEIETAEAEYNATSVPATLTIRDGDGPTGSVLCTQSIVIVSGLTFRAFPLATPVAVTAGSVYTFELNTGGEDIAVRGSGDDTYTRGRLFHNGQAYDFMKDVNFKTYIVGSTSTGLVVQPSSLNVGIGTMWPAAPLDVAGRAKVGEFQLGTYTTAGHVLTADAKGVGTWQSASTAISSVPAGGDLTGTYPNPTIADGKVDSLALSRDQGSLNKVSGGVLTSLNGQIGIGTTTPSGILAVGGYRGAVDQQCSSGSITGPYLGSLAQSFTAGVSGTLFGIEIEIGSTESGTDVVPATLNVRWGDGTTGTVRSTQPVEVPAGVTFKYFSLATPVSVSAGNRYTFELTTGSRTVYMRPLRVDTYTGGAFYINGGPAPASYDMAFKTYVGNSTATGIAVQPGTLNVGIGTSSPQDMLAVYGALRVDQGDLNGNTLGPGAIRFGSGATGEGIACNRSVSTAGENLWGLDFYTHNVRRMSITLDGYIGIGTTNPAYKLHVNGSVAGVGAYNQLSDARYKTNIEEIPSALDKVESLRGVTFDWKAAEHPEIDFGEGRQAGVLAQEVQQVLPEAVTKSSDGTYSVSYSSLVPLLIEAIKEQQKQIDGLKSELEAVKANR